MSNFTIWIVFLNNVEILKHLAFFVGFLGGSDGKESACNAGDWGSIPGLGRSLTPVFSPGESHGQRSLAGYSPWGHKKSDMTEQLSRAHSTTLFLATIMEL